MKQIDGTSIAQRVHEESKQRIAVLAGRGLRPGLAAVLVGDDPASRAYVRSKDKKAAELGLHSVKYELPADTSQERLVALVRELNADPLIHGILVQS
ncbi:MAG: tetrahydrofolate dehydrogenase/cyclohydrolase catalytic domain-containing protein, partial [Terrimicrobiaceae bacterium]